MSKTLKKIVATANASHSSTDPKILIVKPANGNAAIETKPTVIIDTTAQPQEEAKQETPAITVEAQLKKLTSLTHLNEKREKLLTTSDNLNGFRHASDERTNVLTIDDGKGCEFHTYNPRIIAKVVDMLKVDIDESMTSIDNEIVSIG